MRPLWAESTILFKFSGKGRVFFGKPNVAQWASYHINLYMYMYAHKYMYLYMHV